jgi:replicative DNA helicase
MNLDVTLFQGPMPSQARLVVLNELAKNTHALRDEILMRVRPEHIAIGTYRAIFVDMVDLIHSNGQVDLEQIRDRIRVRESNSSDPDTVEGELANLAQAMSYEPTVEHVKRAIDILTSPVKLKAMPPPKKE